MKKVSSVLIVLIIILSFHCNSEEVNLPSDEIFAIKVVDSGNNHDSRDFIVRFKANNPSIIKELRAFLINPDKFPDFTSTDVAKLPAESYHRITTIESDNLITLGSIKDVEGATLLKDVDYFLGFAVLIENDILLNTQIAGAKFTDAHFLEGKYSGIWDDNFYSGFGVSADLEVNGSVLSGPFWYSNNFQSCCGGQTDGNISMILKDGSITSFRYNQKLASFMGGPCDGSYLGEGIIENLTDLVIFFEGNDCEGEHTGGRLRLVKN